MIALMFSVVSKVIRFPEGVHLSAHISTSEKSYDWLQKYQVLDLHNLFNADNITRIFQRVFQGKIFFEVFNEKKKAVS